LDAGHALLTPHEVREFVVFGAQGGADAANAGTGAASAMTGTAHAAPLTSGRRRTSLVVCVSFSGALKDMFIPRNS
jgi:hypothetical protein